ncbi:endonuclease domain-containing protein [Salinarimonas ramus]|uniref:DNA methyltransferase n=1 Tax=Salinarimonas ramus TaxID=690164 RepID=A0A917Q3V6_9HYPH|nr:endonuclease domain-containing protein [Salinarimonas ramus]GGK18682.1 DNA methyltransferase [Salinarimonas ramus]
MPRQAVGRPSSTVSTATAQRLRFEATPQERRMWAALRRLRPAGYHFRRQVPIGPYVVDFACLKARLLVEIDGAHHGEAPFEARDRARDAHLRREGFRIARYWNGQVLQELPDVMDDLHARLTDPERYWS